MKTGRRGVLVATLLGVSFNLMLLSSLSQAREHPLEARMAGKVGRGAGIVSTHRDITEGRAMNRNNQSLAIATSQGQIMLSDSPVYVPLASAVSATGKEIKLPHRIDTLGFDRRVYLILKSLRASEEPGVLYYIYLDVPKGIIPEKKSPNHVGILNFYGAVVFKGEDDSSAEKFPRSRSYDITALVRILASQKLLTDYTTVTIVPSGRPAPESKPVIGRIELVEQ